MSLLSRFNSYINTKGLARIRTDIISPPASIPVYKRAGRVSACVCVCVYKSFVCTHKMAVWQIKHLKLGLFQGSTWNVKQRPWLNENHDTVYRYFRIKQDLHFTAETMQSKINKAAGKFGTAVWIIGNDIERTCSRFRGRWPLLRYSPLAQVQV